MKEQIKMDYIDLQHYANSIGITAEEYALSLHEKNQAMKSLLLENASDFKTFVTEYHEVLDCFTEYKDAGAKKNTYEHYELIKCVSDILATTSRDPNLLAQLYHHFPKGLDGKGIKSNNPIT